MFVYKLEARGISCENRIWLWKKSIYISRRPEWDYER